MLAQGHRSDRVRMAPTRSLVAVLLEKLRSMHSSAVAAAVDDVAVADDVGGIAGPASLSGRRHRRRRCCYHHVTVRRLCELQQSGSPRAETA